MLGSADRQRRMSTSRNASGQKGHACALAPAMSDTGAKGACGVGWEDASAAAAGAIGGRVSESACMHCMAASEAHAMTSE